MASSDDESQYPKDWAMALNAADCVRVSELLEKNGPHLLNQGWEECKAEVAEDSQVVLKKILEKLDELVSKGSEDDVKYLRERSKKDAERLKKGLKGSKDNAKASLPLNPLEPIWKGRTALHVAARRGDEQLVKAIQKILHPEGKCLTQTYCHVLEVIDSEYELDALAMAVVNGNHRVVNLLKKISRDCQFNPYHIRLGLLPAHEDEESEEDSCLGVMKSSLDVVARITEKALENSTTVLSESLIKLYKADCDFNFLPINLFLFHFTFSTWPSNDILESDVTQIRKYILSRIAKRKVVRDCFLFELCDGQGRTPLHVAVDSNKVDEFLGTIEGVSIEDGERERILNAMDSAGRTPLYRAAAKNHLKDVEDLLAKSNLKVLSTEIKGSIYQWGQNLDIDTLSWRNSFKCSGVYIREEKAQKKTFNNSRNANDLRGLNTSSLTEVSSTALHAAIILEHEDVVARIVAKLLQLFQAAEDVDTDRCKRLFTWPVVAAWNLDNKSICDKRSVTTMKLAVLVGGTRIMRKLLEAEERRPGLFTSRTDENDLPSFHLAAAMGNPGIIKAFLNSNKGKFNPRISDLYHNTALHHALKGKSVNFQPHLIDFVGCNHVRDWISECLANLEEGTQMQRVPLGKDDNGEVNDRYGQRKASINLLLGARIDVWQVNQFSSTAIPESDAPEEFVTWWYETVTQEIKQVQKKLNAAANAISVIAALVATASYLGPLQPPLGYVDDSLQMNIFAVRLFLVCDNLSFYLALCSIMLALLPSLDPSFHIPPESMHGELLRTRITVAAAVTCLFPSIVCILLAFASGYIAVIPEHGLAHHGLTVGSTVVGGLLCLIVVIAFLQRLLTVFYYSIPNDVFKFLTWGLTEIGTMRVDRFLPRFPRVVQDFPRRVLEVSKKVYKGVYVEKDVQDGGEGDKKSWRVQDAQDDGEGDTESLRMTDAQDDGEGDTESLRMTDAQDDGEEDTESLRMTETQDDSEGETQSSEADTSPKPVIPSIELLDQYYKNENHSSQGVTAVN